MEEIKYTTRQQAMLWWNNLASLRKTQICDTNTELIGSIRRWETLTGSEIEKIWENNLETKIQQIKTIFESVPDDEKSQVISQSGIIDWYKRNIY